MFQQTVDIAIGENHTKLGLISMQGNDSQRSDDTAEIGKPLILSISHEEKKGVQRHMARFDKTVGITNPDGTISKGTATAYVVFVHPSTVVTKDDVMSVWSLLGAFLGQTESGASNINARRLLNNEP